jgi:hypothetical protein
MGNFVDRRIIATPNAEELARNGTRVAPPIRPRLQLIEELEIKKANSKLIGSWTFSFQWPDDFLRTALLVFNADGTGYSSSDADTSKFNWTFKNGQVEWTFIESGVTYIGILIGNRLEGTMSGVRPDGDPIAGTWSAVKEMPFYP